MYVCMYKCMYIQYIQGLRQSRLSTADHALLCWTVYRAVAWQRSNQIRYNNNYLRLGLLDTYNMTLPLRGHQIHCIYKKENVRLRIGFILLRIGACAKALVNRLPSIQGL
jgi:hypothetical protein